MTLEQWRFQNPLNILLANEARSCKGCTHSAVVFDRQYCGKGKKHGKRCGAYALENQREKAMPQVRKLEVVDTFHDLTPYQRAMAVWARWMRLDDHQYSDGEAHPQDVKEMMRTAEAIEAMVNDLPRHLWWAVRKGHGICTVWNFPNMDLGEALIKAEEILTAKMQNNVVVRRFFS